MYEEWKPVVGYEGLYSVSSCGRVRRDAPGRGAIAGRILRDHVVAKRGGYKGVALCRDGQLRSFTVHCLVAIAHIGPRPAGSIINHIDGNPANNCKSNLEYGTQSYNLLHSRDVLGRKLGRAAAATTPVGELNGRAVLNEKIVRLCRRLWPFGFSFEELARIFGASPSNISRAVRRKSWRNVA